MKKQNIKRYKSDSFSLELGRWHGRDSVGTAGLETGISRETRKVRGHFVTLIKVSLYEMDNIWITSYRCNLKRTKRAC